MGNGKIFEVIKPYNNDRLSDLSNINLYNFISKLKGHYLDLRESLNFANNITFGIEIEIENIKDEFYILEKNRNFFGWKFSSDDTLLNGREVISPIFKDRKSTWKNIFSLLQDLGECSVILSTCGGHIHIGSQILGCDYTYYEKLFNLWKAYENVIFRFGYGEYISERNVISNFAEPLIYIEDFKTLYHQYRNRALNWSKIGGVKDFNKYEYIKNCTFEVRSPNGSLNPIIWQNNINFFVRLFEYAKSDKFDENLILKRIDILKNNLEV